MYDIKCRTSGVILQHKTEKENFYEKNCIVHVVGIGVLRVC